MPGYSLKVSHWVARAQWAYLLSDGGRSGSVSSWLKRIVVTCMPGEHEKHGHQAPVHTQLPYTPWLTFHAGISEFRSSLRDVVRHCGWNIRSSGRRGGSAVLVSASGSSSLKNKLGSDGRCCDDFFSCDCPWILPQDRLSDAGYPEAGHYP